MRNDLPGIFRVSYSTRLGQTRGQGRLRFTWQPDGNKSLMSILYARRYALLALAVSQESVDKLSAAKTGKTQCPIPLEPSGGRGGSRDNMPVVIGAEAKGGPVVFGRV